MKKFGVILLSGGLDSTTVAAMAVRQGYDLLAVTVRYGQLHVRELEAARDVARHLGLRHQIVDMGFYRNLAWYSALTNPERFAIPAQRAADEMADDIPLTYVPLRNTLFLTLGAAWLESEVLQAVEEQGTSPDDVEASLFIAANAVDYSGYPDCRPEYYEAIAKTLHLGSKIGTQYGIACSIQTPLIAMSKEEIVRAAIDVEAPLEFTWSCYAGGNRPCGTCDSCILRAKGFEQAGEPDPAMEVVEL